MKPHLFAATLLFGLLPLAPARQVALEVELAQPVVSVPMVTSHDHLGLEVQLGDEEPCWFNLDTYAVTTACIDKRLAQRLGYEKVGTTLNGDGSGVTHRRDIVLIPKLRVGGATFVNVRALVDDYSRFKGVEGEPLEGLLGYHLFRELLLELDYPNQRVVLQRGGLSGDEPNVITHAALRERPDIPIRIGDRVLIAGLDSGAQSGLSLPYSMMSELQLSAEPRRVGTASTVYGSAPVWLGQLSDPIRFAGHEVDQHVATFSELFGHPLFGHELLKSYSVSFDQQHGRVRFALPEAAVEARDDE